ncbi:hypothetical protein CT0861_04157 [Colletotrichum tofieldiae]|uniref:Mid2 domain-containing protein n=1 Tax=Colletotrichum tofieldiae TaxID=708197 RepID=A0A161W994_9PEZI|nr:hypothetical protein CT0861_04157 [Colletotrichum tofieldiae]
MSTCFDRSSNQDLGLVACDPNGDLKSCCAPSDSCASNGLCVTNRTDTLTPYFINGCTEQNWNSATCLNQCDQSGGNGVLPCGRGKFCCYGLEGCDCNNATAVFSLDPVIVVTSIPISASKTSSVSATTSTTASTSTAESTASAPTASLDSEPTPSAGSVLESSNHGNVLSVGLGVGLGVGIPLIAFVVGLVWFLKKRRRSKPVAVTPQEPTKQEINYHALHRTEELDTGHYRAELQVDYPPAELPGSRL